MNFPKTSIALMGLVAVSACAQKSEDISAAYVSPLAFQSHSCAQLGAEAERVSARAAEAIARQDKQASDDAAATAVSLILFWPAAFFIEGDDETAAEVARLKGEMEAIEQANIQRNCGLPLSNG